MRKPITRKCEWLCANIEGNIKYIYIFRESKNPNPSRSFVLRWGGHLAPCLAPECLWILDRFDVFREGVKTL